MLFEAGTAIVPLSGRVGADRVYCMFGNAVSLIDLDANLRKKCLLTIFYPFLDDFDVWTDFLMCSIADKNIRR
jgi:hypothetical protein